MEFHLILIIFENSFGLLWQRWGLQAIGFYLSDEIWSCASGQGTENWLTYTSSTFKLHKYNIEYVYLHIGSICLGVFV